MQTANKCQTHFAACLKHTPEQPGHNSTGARDGKMENSCAQNQI